MKPGPLIAMVGMIFVGIWLVLQPAMERAERIDPAAHRFKLDFGSQRIIVEQRERADGTLEYHSKGWDGVDRQGWIAEELFQTLMIAEMSTWERRPSWERTLMNFLNISNWLNFGWVALGLLGQACFFGRMFVQWYKSEKEGVSVVPIAFWWMSFLGGILLFTYFVWRADFVGVLGQSSGVVIYARNLRLISKERQRHRTAKSLLEQGHETDAG